MELRDSHRRSAKSTKPTPIAVVVIVVVHDKERPRDFWRQARVEDLITETDGLVRGASIKVKVGKTETSNSTFVPVVDKK